MNRRPPQQTSALIELLHAADVEFAIIGGVAAMFHGSARITLDLDVVAPFSVENLQRILDALRPHDPRHVTRPDLSVLDEPLEHLRTFRMLLIDTKLGRLDVLARVEPFGPYSSVPTVEMTVYDRSCRVIELDALIEAKRSAGRRKDIEAVYELEALRDALSKRQR